MMSNIFFPIVVNDLEQQLKHFQLDKMQIARYARAISVMLEVSYHDLVREKINNIEETIYQNYSYGRK